MKNNNWDNLDGATIGVNPFASPSPQPTVIVEEGALGTATADRNVYQSTFRPSVNDSQNNVPEKGLSKNVVIGIVAGVLILGGIGYMVWRKRK